MSEPDNPRRHQPPRDLGRVVIVLAVILGALACVAIVVAVLALSRVAQQQKDMQDSRRALGSLTCGAINDNARAVNAQSRYLQRLIVSGTTASKPFEKVYRSLGLPPYKQRLSEARTYAHGLKKLDVPVLPCRALDDAVAKNLTTLPKPSKPK